MKKIFLFLMTVHILSLNAQEPIDEDSISTSQENKEWRKKFINLNFTNAKMSQKDMPDLKSNYGAALTIGRTFYLHKPIANMLRFGIDATWFDLNYSNYDIEHNTYEETQKYQYHQGEISMHVGPSVTFEPIKKFAVHAYFQYAPTFAILYAEDRENVYGNYASLWVAGGNVSYRFIGLGIESRFGSISYKPFVSSDEENIKSDLSGFRVYVTFKF